MVAFSQCALPVAMVGVPTSVGAVPLPVAASGSRLAVKTGPGLCPAASG